MLGLPRVSVAATRCMVMETARQQNEGTLHEVAQLCLVLEGQTGCPIAELAEHARAWSVAVPRETPA